MKKRIIIVISFFLALLLCFLGFYAINNDIFIGEPKTTEIDYNSYSITRVGWSENGFADMVALAENPQKMTISVQQHLPIIRIDSKKELDEFTKTAKSKFDLWKWEETVEKLYGEEYFKDNVLFIIYKDEGSGSIDHYVGDCYKTGNSLLIELAVVTPEAGDCDMAAYFIGVEFKRSEIKDLKKTDAVAVKGNAKY